jgi:molecular chaperone HtpG
MFGANKEKLQDLIMFKTSTSDVYTTFKEYVERKPESQKAIYYATGKSKQAINALPQMDVMKDKGYEVLVLTDEIDEFMIQVIQNYQDIPFKSIQKDEADFIDDDQKKNLKSKEKENKDILKSIKEALKDKVKDVKLSARLKEAPVCLVSGEGISMEMEKILKTMPNATNVHADKILEINPDHELFHALKKVHEQSEGNVKDYASILYHQALLIEGLPIEDPTEFTQSLIRLMIEASK